MVYNNKWVKLRNKYINEHPYCVLCWATRKLHVDHIVPHNNNMDLFWDYDNLQTLCLSCHTGKTREDEKIYNVFNNKYLPRDYTIIISNDKPNSLTDDLITFKDNNWIKIIRVLINDYVPARAGDRVIRVGDIPDEYKIHLISSILKVNYSQQQLLPLFATIDETITKKTKILLSNWLGYFIGVETREGGF